MPTAIKANLRVTIVFIIFRQSLSISARDRDKPACHLKPQSY
jgi:hypothetical protein